MFVGLRCDKFCSGIIINNTTNYDMTLFEQHILFTLHANLPSYVNCHDLASLTEVVKQTLHETDWDKLQQHLLCR